jgi:L-ascorbate metabolism protein UlaG (beta-lactamase superfamily)
MQVTVLGHASLFFQADEERVLLDPVLRTSSLMGGLVHQYPRDLDLERLPTPTLIVITHAHFDHFDPESLSLLPKDIPVVIPPDRRMARRLTAAGFSDLRQLDTWQTEEQGAVRLTATPSDAPVTEFGLLVETADSRLWHMSDAEPPPDTAQHILSAYGPVDVVAAKYQPTDPQLNFQHNMGSSFDRQSVANWLEAASSCAPKLAFPYASGLCFEGDRMWLNRYAYPFSVEFVAQLLRQRLGTTGTAAVVRPGDVISIDGSGVDVAHQASTFVRQSGPETPVEWEPFDERCLRGVQGGEERRALEENLAAVLLDGEFGDWLAGQCHDDTGALGAFHTWGARCQLVVHWGDGERWYAHVDFSTGTPRVRPGRTPAASYFTHIGADAARRLLAGQASALQIMLEGHVFIHERLVALRNSRLAAPDTVRLYERFPDPLLTFAGKRASRVRRVRSGTPA